MPGQIPRNGNPLENLASEPLSQGRPLSRTTANEDDDAVPVPVRRPETIKPVRLAPHHKKPKPKRG